MRLFAIVAIVFISACSSNASSAIAPAPQTTNVFPRVVQQQGGGPWVSFSVPTQTSLSVYASFAEGYDGATWYCGIDNYNGGFGEIGRVDMRGNITLQDTTTCRAITRNQDGNLYFLSGSYGGLDTLGVINKAGTISYVPVQGVIANGTGYWMLSGGDGALYLLARDSASAGVFRVTTSGVATQLAQPGQGLYKWITAGSDHNVWYYDDCRESGCPSPLVVKYNVSSQSITSYSVPPSTGLAGASDGGIWFDEGSAMGRIDATTGALTSYPIAHSFPAVQIIQGYPDALFILDHSPVVHEFSLRKHALVRSWTIPNQQVDDRASELLGPDFNIWVPSGGVLHGGLAGYGLNVLVLHVLTTQPTSITLPVGGTSPLSASETHYLNGTFTATSSKPSVAQVSSTSKNTFTVTGVGVGTCAVTVADIHGNLVDVSVTVQ